MNIRISGGWKDYELIDSGGLEKLERFGDHILARPEPQAVWSKTLTETEWDRILHARYRRTRGIDPGRTEGSDKGEWIRRKPSPDQWMIHYSYGNMELTFRLGLTSFGHIGVFPEQADNWNYIYDIITQNSKFKIQNSSLKTKTDPSSTSLQTVQLPNHQIEKPSVQLTRFKVLNLFAYTGGSSLAAKAAGADVVHVDSVKPVVTWAKEMMESSGLKDIRWVVEDAMKFVKREIRRGNIYQGIILDPPAYGRGPEGEKWILQEGINELIGYCHQLLDPQRAFFIVSLYSMGFSSLIADNLVKDHFGDIAGKEIGELCFTDRAGRRLPLGTYLRFHYEKI